MTDAAFLELLASYGAALDAASSALDTAKALAEAHRTGERLSPHTIEQTLTRIARHEADLVELREKVTQFKRMFRVH